MYVRWVLAGALALALLATIPGQAANEPFVSVIDDEDCTAPSGDLSGLPVMSVDMMLAKTDELFAAYADVPGFVDVYYRPGEAVLFWPTFVGVVPVQAYAVEVDVPVAFDVIEGYQTLMEAADARGAPAETSGPGDLPSGSDITCTGIRPGARITSSIGICTLAFMFTDGTDVYASTAGHCVNQGSTVRLASGSTVGTAVYSIAQGPGRDFALIKVRDAMLPFVDPEMCFFGGPIDDSPSSILGLPVAHTGHGGGIFNAPPRPKYGIGGSWGSASFTWWGAGIPGDSGSGIQTGTGSAMGVVTHIIIGVTLGDNAGTRYTRGLQLAGMTHLDLMLDDELHFI